MKKKVFIAVATLLFILICGALVYLRCVNSVLEYYSFKMVNIKLVGTLANYAVSDYEWEVRECPAYKSDKEAQDALRKEQKAMYDELTEAITHEAEPWEFWENSKKLSTKYLLMRIYHPRWYNKGRFLELINRFEKRKISKEEFLQFAKDNGWEVKFLNY